MTHLSPSEHIGTLVIYPYLLLSDELTLFQAGGEGQIMATIYTCPHLIWKFSAGPAVATSINHLQIVLKLATHKSGTHLYRPEGVVLVQVGL